MHFILFTELSVSMATRIGFILPGARQNMHLKKKHTKKTILTLITTAFECFSFRVRLHEIAFCPGVSFVTSSILLNKRTTALIGILSHFQAQFLYWFFHILLAFIISVLKSLFQFCIDLLNLDETATLNPYFLTVRVFPITRATSQENLSTGPHRGEMLFGLQSVKDWIVA